LFTWNVNRFPVQPNFTSLAQFLLNQSKDNLPHLYCIGLQEAGIDATYDGPPSLSYTPSLFISPGQIDQWILLIEQDFKSLSTSPNDTFRCLAHVHLGGILQLLFVRESCRSCIQDVQISTVAVGPLGFPNKGATGISFLWRSIPVCFLNLHLVHGTDPARRCRQWESIASRIVFEPRYSSWEGQVRKCDGPADSTSSPNSHLHAQNKVSQGNDIAGVTSVDDDAPLISQPSAYGRNYASRSYEPISTPLLNRTLGDHDIVFVFGDLNFRLNAPSFAQVHNLILGNRVGEMMELDQLSIAKDHGTLLDFEEARISFLPTYRRLPSRGQFDDPAGFRANFDSRRVPGYTDRILFSVTNPTLRISSLWYDAWTEFLESDHTPVVGLFSIDPHDPAQVSVTSNERTRSTPLDPLWQQKRSLTRAIQFVLRSKMRLGLVLLITVIIVISLAITIVILFRKVALRH
jgi:hypothetical protein